MFIESVLALSGVLCLTAIFIFSLYMLVVSEYLFLKVMGVTFVILYGTVAYLLVTMGV